MASAIKNCRIAIHFESESGYASQQTYAGEGHADMLAAFRELGRILCIAGKGVEVLEAAAEVKAAVQRDIGDAKAQDESAT
ncbi:hypothetical protein QYH69_32230 [Paraburkholderia sp. SARCC-3016]|uniref:hypothetical protein n=1 Tax=Paraburkholderia sp. SARCC-3016 TaxID=3058611 RepID=UPI00280822B1|nr:hypothetical protein [Paraburkholderia sp. SARCC-3016]MDQ7981892.1 hypothetical protein [Paraburkholderia sp. SARCC-3016]